MPGFQGTCEDYGVYYQPGYCGDGYCGEVDGEDPQTCASDCFLGPGSSPSNWPVCGSRGCEPGESNRSCPQDCPQQQPQVCGDGYCEGTESVSNCIQDCMYSDFCWDSTECYGWATCRANRCVDGFPDICYASQGLGACGSYQKCVQLDNGYGICVNVF